jgi:hypothetical protein
LDDIAHAAGLKDEKTQLDDKNSFKNIPYGENYFFGHRKNGGFIDKNYQFPITTPQATPAPNVASA